MVEPGFRSCGERPSRAVAEIGWISRAICAPSAGRVTVVTPSFMPVVTSDRLKGLLVDTRTSAGMEMATFAPS